jgi:thiol-disulfide isomerase/thioredoxin
MKKILLVFLFIVISINFAICEELTLYFKNLYRLPHEKSENTTPLYFKNFDTIWKRIDTSRKHDKPIPIKLPDMKHSADTTFFKEFFTGWEKPAFSRETMFLVGNYKADTTYIWADLNNNLDFTDDNAFYIIAKDNPNVYIALPNSKNPDGKFLYKFNKKVYSDTAQRNIVREHFYNDGKKKGFITTECDYWIGETRLNILSCDTVIDGKRVQIGIIDWNCNGLFNDIDTVSKDNFHSDRVLVGVYGSEIISYKPSCGAVQMLPETLIPINGIFYLLTEVEPSGKYIKILKTDKYYKILKEGDSLPDMKFTLFDGQKVSFSEKIVRGKFNLVDMWGFWCQGCVIAIPKLKLLDSIYSDKLNIIGLHHNESSHEIAKKTVDKYVMKWTQGFLNADIEKKLLSSGAYPYYVLIGPDGNIYKFEANLKEVEEILKKN